MIHRLVFSFSSYHKNIELRLHFSSLLLALLFAAACTLLSQNCYCYASSSVVPVLCSRLYLHRSRGFYTLQFRCVQHVHIQSSSELDVSNSHTMSQLMSQTC